MLSRTPHSLFIAQPHMTWPYPGITVTWLALLYVRVLDIRDWYSRRSLLSVLLHFDNIIRLGKRYCLILRGAVLFWVSRFTLLNTIGATQ